MDIKNALLKEGMRGNRPDSFVDVSQLQRLISYWRILDCVGCNRKPQCLLTTRSVATPYNLQFISEHAGVVVLV